MSYEQLKFEFNDFDDLFVRNNYVPLYENDLIIFGQGIPVQK